MALDLGVDIDAVGLCSYRVLTNLRVSDFVTIVANMEQNLMVSVGMTGRSLIA